MAMIVDGMKIDGFGSDGDDSGLVWIDFPWAKNPRSNIQVKFE